MLNVCLLFVSAALLLLLPVRQAQAQTESFMEVRPGCSTAAFNGATEVRWTGDCAQGKTSGLGALSFRLCRPTCTWISIVGVSNAGNFSGMSVVYAGDTNAANEEISVLFSDNTGYEVAPSRVSDKRTAVQIPTPERRLTWYIAQPTGIAGAAKTPQLGNGLTLDEVFLLWERWNSNPGSGPPSDLSAALQGVSRTANYFREKDAALAERDRQFAEWKQRRDSRREERSRMEAEQQALDRALQQRQQANLDQARLLQEQARRQVVGSMLPAPAGTVATSTSQSIQPSGTGDPADRTAWVNNADVRHCGVSTSDTRAPGENLQWFTMKNICSVPIKVYMSTRADTSQFGDLTELQPNASSRNWWLLTTRQTMEFIVCPTVGPQGQAIRLHEPTKTCYFLR